MECMGQPSYIKVIPRINRKILVPRLFEMEMIKPMTITFVIKPGTGNSLQQVFLLDCLISVFGFIEHLYKPTVLSLIEFKISDEVIEVRCSILDWFPNKLRWKT